MVATNWAKVLIKIIKIYVILCLIVKEILIDMLSSIEYVLLLSFFKPDVLSLFSLFDVERPQLLFLYLFGFFTVVFLTLFINRPMIILSFLDALLNINN